MCLVLIYEFPTPNLVLSLLSRVHYSFLKLIQCYGFVLHLHHILSHKRLFARYFHLRILSDVIPVTL